MPRYHINSKGEPGVCKARKACPFGDLEQDHYSSEEEARVAYENFMQKTDASEYVRMKKAVARREELRPQIENLQKLIKKADEDYSIASQKLFKKRKMARIEASMQEYRALLATLNQEKTNAYYTNLQIKDAFVIKYKNAKLKAFLKQTPEERARQWATFERDDYYIQLREASKYATVEDVKGMLSNGRCNPTDYILRDNMPLPAWEEWPPGAARFVKNPGMMLKVNNIEAYRSEKDSFLTGATSGQLAMLMSQMENVLTQEEKDELAMVNQVAKEREKAAQEEERRRYKAQQDRAEKERQEAAARRRRQEQYHNSYNNSLYEQRQQANRNLLFAIALS